MAMHFNANSRRPGPTLVGVVGAAVLVLLMILGGSLHMPTGTRMGRISAATMPTCNSPSSQPSALFIPQSVPGHPLLKSGTLQASYEFEVVNYTTTDNGTDVVVPNVLALFPLSTGPDFQVPLSWVDIKIAGPGWSNPSSTTARTTVAVNLSFSSSVPPQLLTEGWLPANPHADAVLAQATYGTLTLAFRWQWSMTEPNGTVDSSSWSVPSRSANPPYLPSVFYPAEHVWSQSVTAPLLIGGDFTADLRGMVAGRSFNLTWTDTSGHLLALGHLNVSAGAANASAALPLTSPSHRLAPGTYVFHVTDSCGAVVSDEWLSASYPTSATVQVGITPSSCGAIILNGTVFQSGAAPTYRPSPTSYSLTSTGCPGDAFTGWNETGGVLPISEWARNTRVLISWNGTVAAAWGPGYNVTFRESGVTKGQNWSVSIHGSTAEAVAPKPVTFFLANGTYPYYVGNGTGYSLSGANSSGTVRVHGGATSVNLSLAPDIQHVVVVMMENVNLYTALADAPYMTYLWNTDARASKFYGACHQSKPEYMAMTSGRPFTCASIPVENVSNLGDLLETKGLSWMDYQESMNSPCETVSTQLYFGNHNPFIWYSDIVNNATRCDAHVVNSRYFNQSVANGTLPAYSLYVPNTEDDCEYSYYYVCDAWLKSFLGPMLNDSRSTVRALVAHTAFIVAFDEALTNLGYSQGGIVNGWCKSNLSANLSVCGGHTYLTVVSPYSRGLTDPVNATDYNIESTIEWLFGLGNDGGYDGTSNFPSMSSLFSFPQNGED